MAEGSSSGLTQILVAVIGVTGVIAAALFANWDKIFPRGAAPAQSNVVPTAQPPAENASTTPPVDTLPSQETGLSGTWHDDDGYTYLVTQSGSSVRYIQRQNGRNVGTGLGTLSGRTLHYAWEGGGNQGHCDATVEPAGRALAGTCTDGANSWPFRIER